MIKLLEIEWYKLKNFRPFWVLIAMYALAITIISCSGMSFLEYLSAEGEEFRGINPTLLPIYDFPDIWQNVTFMTTVFKVILGFIVVINISNESRFRTLRQNVIDGLSKADFLISKLIFISVLALASTLLIFILGIIMGNIYSHPDGLPYMFHSLDFLFAHFLAVFTYLAFAMLITLILPRAGLVIVGLLLYTLIFEPILSAILWNYPHFSDWVRLIPDFLPITSLNNLIHVPFPKYVFFEIQDFVAFKSILIAIGWLIFNIIMSYRVLRWKDW